MQTLITWPSKPNPGCKVKSGRWYWVPPSSGQVAWAVFDPPTTLKTWFKVQGGIHVQTAIRYQSKGTQTKESNKVIVAWLCPCPRVSLQGLDRSRRWPRNEPAMWFHNHPNQCKSLQEISQWHQVNRAEVNDSGFLSATQTQQFETLEPRV